MYYEAPEDAIQDDFDELLFPNHPLGVNILGTQETVKSFTQSHLHQFIDRNLDTSRIVISSIGKLPHEKVFAWAENMPGGSKVKKNILIESFRRPWYRLKKSPKEALHNPI